MCAGDAEGVGIVLGDGAPGLGALKYGYPLLPGGKDLRIIVVNGSGADHKFHIVGNILPMVTGDDRYSVLPQVAHIGRLVHVRAGDAQAHAAEHLRQGGHGHAAYADKMAPSSGGEEIIKIYHKTSSKMSIDVTLPKC